MTEASDTVLFDGVDLRVGTQNVQVGLGEGSGVAIDDLEVMGDVAIGLLDVLFDGVGVDSERNTLLDGNDIPARDGFLS